MQETWCADARTVRPEGWCLLSPWRIFQWCGDACHTIYCRQLNNLDIHKVEAKKVASDGVAEEKSWKVLSLHVIRDTIRVYETSTSTRRMGAMGGERGRVVVFVWWQKNARDSEKSTSIQALSETALKRIFLPLIFLLHITELCPS